MIRPTKYLDLNTCILNVAAAILAELKLTQVIPLGELDMVIRNRTGDEARFNFLPALNFLYLVGKIDYDEIADAVIFLDRVKER